MENVFSIRTTMKQKKALESCSTKLGTNKCKLVREMINYLMNDKNRKAEFIKVVKKNLEEHE